MNIQYIKVKFYLKYAKRREYYFRVGSREFGERSRE
jgi:hypothetical protein